ncbi:MAG: STAS domain-containing protein [Bacteroidota bacterium]
MDQAYAISQVGNIKVLRVNSLLSEFTNREILQLAQDCIDQGFTKFVVNLGGMPYTNSVGLNFLISLQARCQDQAGAVVVSQISDKIIQLLEVTKLRPLFTITQSEEEALALINEL